MRALPVLALLLGTSLAATANAQSARIYQWKDASGTTHYSDSPPAGEATRRVIGSGNGYPLPEEEAAKPAEVEHPMCTLARRNLQILGGGNPVMRDADGDGKADTELDATARANEKAVAEAQVRAYCKNVDPENAAR